MTCSGKDQMCENAGDVGTSQVCKADEDWCTKMKIELPKNGYSRGCGGEKDLSDLFTALKGKGLDIEIMCFKMVTKKISFLTSIIKFEKGI